MNILIVRNDKLGDFITALPACYILKQHMPDCHITVLISPINQSIAEACSFIDNVLLDTGQSTTALAKELQQGDFDISFTLFSNTRVAIAQWLARIPKRIAPATKVAQVFYNQRIMQRRSQVKMPEFAYNIQLIQAACPDISTQYPQPLLQFSHQDIQTTYQTFCKNLRVQHPVIAFHPGFGGSSDANWNIEEYITLAESIQNLPNIDIIFTFGPGDEAFHQAFMAKKGDLAAKTYTSQGSVADFSKLIASFKLFISTSTGTFHLASAVGTPTMTFFADSLFASDKRWQGIGDKTLQHNYMIPQDPQERQKLFETVQKDLQQLIS
ncbi:glycosyltransferase family 9 protein [Ghiorsea bivora]|uniref:glycosyltransferase family 9 protein n=1 Tax=Ghiorsea bivora TaxID=1485545 RepID=UPI00056E6879|nr:glycosyltransferase family 9 protein [Ghiorsea bivora]